MSSVWTRLRGYGEARVRAGRTSRHVAPALMINRMYHVYDIMGPPGRRIARHVRDSSIPLTVDGTARRVPGKGPGTGSGRVERRAAVLLGFAYFVSIHTVPPVPRGPVGKVYRDVPEAYKPLFTVQQEEGGKGVKDIK